MFQPAVSPHDSNLMFVSCDMSGFYRSQDGGRHWTMLEGRMIRGGTGAIVRFDPTDPRVVYAYADGSGGPALRVSHDRGVTWRVFVEKPPWSDHPVTAISTDPWIVGTSDGVFFSSDGARTWQAAGLHGSVVGLFVPTFQSQDSLARIEPDRPSVFVATADGVFRGGRDRTRWQPVSESLPWAGIRHFAAGTDHPTGRTVLWVTIPSRAVNGKFEGGVYRSTDGGVHWESAMGTGIDNTLGKKDEYGAGDIAQYDFIACDVNHPDTVYVTGSGTGYWPPYHYTVYRSDDGGKAWRYVFTGDPRFKDRNVDIGWQPWDLGWGFGGPPWGFTISATHPDVAMYTNSGELYVTDNGGKTWRAGYTQRTTGEGPPGPRQAWESVGLEVTTCWHYRIDPHNPQAHYLCYTDIGFERSEDGGKSWTSRLDGDPWGNTIYDVAPDPDVHGRIWGAASNQHDIPHWTQQEGANPNWGKGGVVYSEDGGRHWTVKGTGLPAAPAISVVIDPRSPRDQRRLWASLYGAGVFRSDDGGASWSASSQGLGVPGNLNSYELQLMSNGDLYCSITAKRVGNHYSIPGGLWRSRDGGGHWEWLTASLRPLGMMGYCIDPRRAGILYVTTSSTNDDPGGAGGPAGVFKSTDDGKTWRRLPLLPGPAGEGWSMECYSAFLHPDDPDTLFVTTTGLGIWMSRDAGDHWQAFKAIPFMAPHRMLWDPRDHHVVYITTFGGGAWKVTFR